MPGFAPSVSASWRVCLSPPKAIAFKRTWTNTRKLRASYLVFNLSPWIRLPQRRCLTLSVCVAPLYFLDRFPRRMPSPGSSRFRAAAFRSWPNCFPTISYAHRKSNVDPPIGQQLRCAYANRFAISADGD